MENLIEALPHLSHIPELRLMIIGGGEHSQRDIEQLRKLAHNLEVGSSVDFLGLIKHEDLPYFYNAADACVVPSYYESFGLVALESLACGTPVVATDVGHHKTLIRQGDTGYVTKDNDPRRLADKIALLLSRSESSTESAQSIRETVNKLSWSNIAEAIAKDCQLVLAKHIAP
jgi:D-inositol-3-phosphate glycosyltransferase